MYNYQTISFAGSGTAKSVEIIGNEMTGLRGNAIQLYTFNYPILVKDNVINSWGINASTSAGADDDSAIRGTLGATGTLTLTNNYFGMDETSSYFNVNVVNYSGNTDHTRAAGTYSESATR